MFSAENLGLGVSYRTVSLGYGLYENSMAGYLLSCGIVGFWCMIGVFDDKATETPVMSLKAHPVRCAWAIHPCLGRATSPGEP